MLLSLQPIFDYFGAQNSPLRGPHERDRALERVVFGVIFALAILWLSRKAGSDGGAVGRSVVEGWPPLALVLIGYAAVSVLYYLLVRASPQDGVAAQYLFLLADPVLTIAVVAYEPRVMTGLAVFLIVIISRCGIRYGVRALMLSWTAAAVGALAIMGRREFIEANENTVVTVASLLGFGVPLFIPLVRTLHKSRDLELEKVKVEALAESLSAKSEFLSKVSHELKSPLQSILSTLDVFELRHEQPDDLALIQRIRRATSHVATQLGDLLTLARSEAGKLSLRPKLVDVSALFAEMCEQVDEAAMAKGLRLVVDLPSEPVVVVIDSIRVSQVAENLLSNAVKYTEQGTVTLRLQSYDAEAGAIRFSVGDTGAGIAPEDRLVIFAPFERATQAYSRDSAGIGLAVVQALLAHMGGKVALVSEVGSGSTFSVEVPAAGAERPQAPHGRGRVLVIDDREDVLTGLVEVITELGYTADSAVSVGAASNLLAAVRYDAVLFDLQMPVKSGDELAMEIRQGDGPNREARFIAMTAADDADAGRQWPFNDFVRKPIAARTLRRLLAAQPV